MALDGLESVAKQAARNQKINVTKYADDFVITVSLNNVKLMQEIYNRQPAGIIFFSILAMNIGYYRSLHLPGVYAYLFIAKNFEPDAA